MVLPLFYPIITHMISLTKPSLFFLHGTSKTGSDLQTRLRVCACVLCLCVCVCLCRVCVCMCVERVCVHVSQGCNIAPYPSPSYIFLSNHSWFAWVAITAISLVLIPSCACISRSLYHGCCRGTPSIRITGAVIPL